MAHEPYQPIEYVPPYETNYDPNARELTSQRVHELALQHWFNVNFELKQGYPTPVIFASPRDAFHNFTELWRDATNPTNPFNYLLKLGYEPYPANLRYPLISITRAGESPRVTQSYSVHRYRRIMWPTVSADVDREDLGWVTQARMPQAWDFRFQVDHFATRPETYAAFRGRLRQALPFMGGSPQAFIVARYPGYYGPQFLRLYLEGNIENTSPTEFQDSAVEFRTSFTLVLEGYEVFLNMRWMPTLWNLAVGMYPVNPGQLSDFYAVDPVSEEWNLREGGGNNPVVDSRIPALPASGTVEDSGTAEE